MNENSPPRWPPLLALDDAIERILARVAAPDAERAETVSTFDALGRVLAADVRSRIDVPPADNSEMDGYALRTADVAAPGTVLPVSQRIAAGSVGAPLAAGTAARIFTGAQVPRAPTLSSCRSSAASSTAASNRRRVAPASRSAAAARTSSAARASSAPESGLSPQASGWRPRSARRPCGRAPAARRLFFTGDELAMPGEALEPGAIYNSNRFMLRGADRVARRRPRRPRHRPRQPRRDARRARAARRDERPDRHLRRCLGRRGGPRQARRRGGRPPRPLADRDEARQAARLWDLPCRRPSLVHRPARQPGLGFVTFLLAVRPVLLRLQGAGDLAPRPIPMRADFDWPKARPAARVPARRRNDAGGLDCSEPGLGGADVDDLGRRPGRQPAADRRSRRATRYATCPSRAARMKVAVRYFAAVREALGSGEESRSAPAPTSARCATRWSRAAAATPRRSAASASCAAPGTCPLRRGDAARRRRRGRLLSAPHRRLSGPRWRAPRLDPDRRLRPRRRGRALRAGDGGVGAVCAFIGTVRDRNDGAAVAIAELEHYPGMTEAAIEAMFDEAVRASTSARARRPPRRALTPRPRSCWSP